MLEGKWQDFIESEEIMASGGFDVIYTDTFSEDYQGESRAHCLPPTFLIALQSCRNSLGTSPICSRGQSQDSVSSMALARQVSALLFQDDG